MLDRLNKMIPGPKMPELIVAQRVIDKMMQAAGEYIADETGEAMVGLVVDDRASETTSLYVLDTIAPGTDVVRESHTFQQGSVWQDDVLNWLRENWQVARLKRRGSYGKAMGAKWDASLYHVGDWHKQPGFMIHPSWADRETALDWIHQPGNTLGFLLAPILTRDHPPTVDEDETAGNFILMPQDDGLFTRVDWWYIARGMLGFQAIRPQISADDTFPRLMSYPWHLTDDQRAMLEKNRLEADGMLAEILLWDVDDVLPLEICFLTARASGMRHFLIIATPADFPTARPQIYRAPFLGMGPGEDLYDVFERIWPDAELVEDPPGWVWTPEMSLLDYVHAVEDMLGMERPATPEPVETEEEAE